MRAEAPPRTRSPAQAVMAASPKPPQLWETAVQSAVRCISESIAASRAPWKPDQASRVALQVLKNAQGHERTAVMDELARVLDGMKLPVSLDVPGADELLYHTLCLLRVLRMCLCARRPQMDADPLDDVSIEQLLRVLHAKIEALLPMERLGTTEHERRGLTFWKDSDVTAAKEREDQYALMDAIEGIHEVHASEDSFFVLGSSNTVPIAFAPADAFGAPPRKVAAHTYHEVARILFYLSTVRFDTVFSMVAVALRPEPSRGHASETAWLRPDTFALLRMIECMHWRWPQVQSLLRLVPHLPSLPRRVVPAASVAVRRALLVFVHHYPDEFAAVHSPEGNAAFDALLAYTEATRRRSVMWPTLAALLALSGGDVIATAAAQPRHRRDPSALRMATFFETLQSQVGHPRLALPAIFSLELIHRLAAAPQAAAAVEQVLSPRVPDMVRSATTVRDVRVVAVFVASVTRRGDVRNALDILHMCLYTRGASNMGALFVAHVLLLLLSIPLGPRSDWQAALYPPCAPALRRALRNTVQTWLAGEPLEPLSTMLVRDILRVAALDPRMLLTLLPIDERSLVFPATIDALQDDTLGALLLSLWYVSGTVRCFDMPLSLAYVALGVLAQLSGVAWAGLPQASLEDVVVTDESAVAMEPSGTATLGVLDLHPVPWDVNIAHGPLPALPAGVPEAVRAALAPHDSSVMAATSSYILSAQFRSDHLHGLLVLESIFLRSTVPEPTVDTTAALLLGLCMPEPFVVRAALDAARALEQHSTLPSPLALLTRRLPDLSMLCAALRSTEARSDAALLTAWTALFRLWDVLRHTEKMQAAPSGSLWHLTHVLAAGARAALSSLTSSALVPDVSRAVCDVLGVPTQLALVHVLLPGLPARVLAVVFRDVRAQSPPSVWLDVLDITAASLVAGAADRALLADMLLVCAQRAVSPSERLAVCRVAHTLYKHADGALDLLRTQLVEEVLAWATTDTSAGLRAAMLDTLDTLTQRYTQRAPDEVLGWHESFEAAALWRTARVVDGLLRLACAGGEPVVAYDSADVFPKAAVRALSNVLRQSPAFLAHEALGLVTAHMATTRAMVMLAMANVFRSEAEQEAHAQSRRPSRSDPRMSNLLDALASGSVASPGVLDSPRGLSLSSSTSPQAIEDNASSLDSPLSGSSMHSGTSTGSPYSLAPMRYEAPEIYRFGPDMHRVQVGLLADHCRVGVALVEAASPAHVPVLEYALGSMLTPVQEHQLLSMLIAAEVRATSSASLLMRTNSARVAYILSFARRTAYLDLQVFVRSVIERVLSLPPGALDFGTDTGARQHSEAQQFILWLTEPLTLFLRRMSAALMAVCIELREQVAARFGHGEVQCHALATFLVLRLLGPALVAPASVGVEVPEGRVSLTRELLFLNKVLVALPQHGFSSHRDLHLTALNDLVAYVSETASHILEEKQHPQLPEDRMRGPPSDADVFTLRTHLASLSPHVGGAVLAALPPKPTWSERMARAAAVDADAFRQQHSYHQARTFADACYVSKSQPRTVCLVLARLESVRTYLAMLAMHVYRTVPLNDAWDLVVDCTCATSRHMPPMQWIAFIITLLPRDVFLHLRTVVLVQAGEAVRCAARLWGDVPEHNPLLARAGRLPRLQWVASDADLVGMEHVRMVLPEATRRVLTSPHVTVLDAHIVLGGWTPRPGALLLTEQYALLRTYDPIHTCDMVPLFDAVIATQGVNVSLTRRSAGDVVCFCTQQPNEVAHALRGAQARLLTFSPAVHRALPSRADVRATFLGMALWHRVAPYVFVRVCADKLLRAVRGEPPSAPMTHPSLDEDAALLHADDEAAAAPVLDAVLDLVASHGGLHTPMPYLSALLARVPPKHQRHALLRLLKLWITHVLTRAKLQPAWDAVRTLPAIAQFADVCVELAPTSTSIVLQGLQDAIVAVHAPDLLGELLARVRMALLEGPRRGDARAYALVGLLGAQCMVRDTPLRAYLPELVAVLVLAAHGPSSATHMHVRFVAVHLANVPHSASLTALTHAALGAWDADADPRRLVAWSRAVLHAWDADPEPLLRLIRQVALARGSVFQLRALDLLGHLVGQLSNDAYDAFREAPVPWSHESAMAVAMRALLHATPRNVAVAHAAVGALVQLMSLEHAPDLFWAGFALIAAGAWAAGVRLARASLDQLENSDVRSVLAKARHAYAADAAALDAVAGVAFERDFGFSAAALLCEPLWIGQRRVKRATFELCFRLIQLLGRAPPGAPHDAAAPADTLHTWQLGLVYLVYFAAPTRDTLDVLTRAVPTEAAAWESAHTHGTAPPPASRVAALKASALAASLLSTANSTQSPVLIQFIARTVVTGELAHTLGTEVCSDDAWTSRSADELPRALTHMRLAGNSDDASASERSAQLLSQTGLSRLLREPAYRVMAVDPCATWIAHIALRYGPLPM